MLTLNESVSISMTSAVRDRIALALVKDLHGLSKIPEVPERAEEPYITLSGYANDERLELHECLRILRYPGYC